MNLSTLLDRNPQLITFDVFDTVLLRRVEEPGCVFEHVAERAVAAGLLDSTTSPTLFRLMRQEAEARARKNAVNGEVLLSDIYREVNIENSAEFIRLELDVEKNICFVNPMLLDFIKKLNQINIPVLFISDMYINSGNLAEIMENAGITSNLYRKIYVSGEVGVSKQQGGLFRRLLADHPDIAPGRIVHIGDDAVGDVMMARAMGLQAIHYVPGPALARYRERESQMTGLERPVGLPIRRLVALAGREDQGDDAAITEFGALVLGPAVAEYCHWVVQECRRQGISRIVPLMREAAIFAPLMQDWASHDRGGPVIAPLHISREALLPLEFQAMSAASARRILSNRPHLAWDRLLVLAGGIVPPALQAWQGYTLERLLAMDGAATALALFDDPAVVTVAGQRAEDVRQLLGEYLDTVLGGDGDVALVDLGARATTPAAIARLIPNGRKRCRIFLAYAVPDIASPLADGMRIQVFSDLDHQGKTLGRILYRSPQILERVLTGLHGTTTGYRRNEQGLVEPVLAPPPATGEERRRLALLQQGIRRYARFMAALPAMTGSNPVPGSAALLPLAAVLMRPSAQEAELLGSLAYDQNDGMRGERVICDGRSLDAVRPLTAQAKTGPVLSLAMGLRPALVPWPQGVLTLLEPGIFQQPADLLALDAGHGPACRTLLRHLLALKIDKFAVIAVGGDGGMGPDFIHYARQSGLEPAAYADLMEDRLAGPVFHGVPVRRLAEMRGFGLPLVLVTLGYEEQLAALMTQGKGASPPLVSISKGLRAAG